MEETRTESGRANSTQKLKRNNLTKAFFQKLKNKTLWEQQMAKMERSQLRISKIENRKQ